MSKYDIDPAGVQRVLNQTSTSAGRFETILEPMSGYIDSAAAGCGGSGAIVPALSDFFEVQGKNLTAINNRINACLTGAASATKAYLHGDEEMVATYQQNAANLKISSYPPK